MNRLMKRPLGKAEVRSTCRDAVGPVDCQHNCQQLAKPVFDFAEASIPQATNTFRFFFTCSEITSYIVETANCAASCSQASSPVIESCKYRWLASLLKSLSRFRPTPHECRVSIMYSYLPRLPYPEARDGYWSPVTSTLNWCEEASCPHACSLLPSLPLGPFL
jgi:hypothetical protein